MTAYQLRCDVILQKTPMRHSRFFNLKRANRIRQTQLLGWPRSPTIERRRLGYLLFYTYCPSGGTHHFLVSSPWPKSIGLSTQNLL